jgi:hypothetical protein
VDICQNTSSGLCNQTIAVGPFNCSSYKAGSWKTYKYGSGVNVGQTDWTCETLPGIGAGDDGTGWPIKFLVRGNPQGDDSGQTPTATKVKFDAPAITGLTVATAPRSLSVVGRKDDPLTITGTNFPDNATASAYEEYTKGKKAAISVKFDTLSVPLDLASLSVTTVPLKIPAGNGKNLPVKLTVGGQDSPAGAKFSYAPPEIQDDGVSPIVGAATGGSKITIKGFNFGDPDATDPNVRVMFVNQSSVNKTSVPCSDVTLKSAGVAMIPRLQQIECTQPASKSLNSVHFKIEVSTGKAGEDDYNQDVTYNQTFDSLGCSDTCQGDHAKCTGAGLCQCDAPNYVTFTSGQTPQHVNKTGCQCPGEKICKHQSTFKEEDCSCTCTGHWEPAPSPAGSAVCDSCSKPCEGTFDSSAPEVDGDNCVCKFNMVHIVWMVAVGLIVIAAIVFAVMRYMKYRASYAVYTNQPGKLDSMNARMLPENNADSDRESQTYV